MSESVLRVPKPTSVRISASIRSGEAPSTIARILGSAAGGAGSSGEPWAWGGGTTSPSWADAADGIVASPTATTPIPVHERITA